MIAQDDLGKRVRDGFGAARYALAIIAVALFLLPIGLVNHVEPFVLGLPFFLFWQVVCIVATSALMGIVYALDPQNKTTKSAPVPMDDES
ncbi:DUF3311 domain-containing protein (plasmid) [Prescottella equi]|uniref:DUF3311 domain-containing protein n=1 Tax=Rhodococcus hoagii TaxID=43767 RepID=UPI002574E3B1|nr:DUF3311 domain-containing protein [Prescottella equi]WJJ14274.1 DUF3311 domain-containing protein [Prescottella equi]